MQYAYICKHLDLNLQKIYNLCIANFQVSFNIFMLVISTDFFSSTRAASYRKAFDMMSKINSIHEAGNSMFCFYFHTLDAQ